METLDSEISNLEVDFKSYRTRQFDILQGFIEHIVYYQELQLWYSSNDMQDNFWCRTINGHFTTALMNWCMVFGTDSNIPHWKNIIRNNELKDMIRSGFNDLFSDADCSWESYHRTMTKFRNEYTAHRDGEYPKAPFLDKAIDICIQYEKVLLDYVFSRISDGHPGYVYPNLISRSKKFAQSGISRIRG